MSGRIVINVIIVLTITGCLPLATLQRASLIGRGHVQFDVEPATLGVLAFPSNPKESPTIGAYPTVGGAVRYGISDSMEFGARLSLAGVESGLKFRLPPPAPGVVAAIAPSVCLNTEVESVQVPLLIGFRIGEHELIVSPKVIDSAYLVWHENNGQLVNYSGLNNVVSFGASLGFAAKIRDGLQLLPEVTFVVPTFGAGNLNVPSGLAFGADGVMFQVALGVLFGG